MKTKPNQSTAARSLLVFFFQVMLYLGDVMAWLGPQEPPHIWIYPAQVTFPVLDKKGPVVAGIPRFHWLCLAGHPCAGSWGQNLQQGDPKWWVPDGDPVPSFLMVTLSGSSWDVQTQFLHLQEWPPEHFPLPTLQVLGLLVWTLIANTTYHLHAAYGWVMFVSIFFWIATVLLFITYLLQLPLKFYVIPWPLVVCNWAWARGMPPGKRLRTAPTQPFARGCCFWPFAF